MQAYRILISLILLNLLASPVPELAAQDKTQAKVEPETEPYNPVDDPDLQKQVDQLLVEYYSYVAERSMEKSKLKTIAEQSVVVGKIFQQHNITSRKLIDLGLKNPKSTAARAAWCWVMDLGKNDSGEHGAELRRAVTLLLQYHGDSSYVASQAVMMNNVASPARDILIYGLNATARSPETRGLAKLALASYLNRKLEWVTASKLRRERSTVRYATLNDKGERVYITEPEPDSQFAYWLEIQSIDPKELETTTIKLLEEVIHDYKDIPYEEGRIRDLKAALKQKEPQVRGKKLSPADVEQLQNRLKQLKSRTLAEAAQAKLDEIQNLVAGKPAPEIEGEGVDGKKFKLSDYRGKAVLLVFWGTWCGPCMAEVPHERKIAEKYKDKPFAIIGVNCDEDRQKAAKAIETEMMGWPNFYDGAPGTGAIAGRYHIRSYPTTFLIDENGIIQDKDHRGEGLEQSIEKMLNKIETLKDSKLKSTDLPKP